MDALAIQRARDVQPSRWAPRLALAAGILTVAAVAAFLLDENFHHAVAFVLMVTVAVLALARPLALLMFLLVQLPLMPRWGTFLGIRVPDPITPLVVALVAGAALWWLANRRRDRMALHMFDVLVVAFLLMGHLHHYSGAEEFDLGKAYFRGVAVPGLAYFAVRMLMLDARRARTVLRVSLLASMALSAIMLAEAASHRSLLYTSMSDQYQVGGIYQPAGAFGTPFFAAAYLAMLVPLYIFGSAGGFGLKNRLVMGIGLGLAVAAIGISLERGAWLATLAALVPCLIYRPLRPRAGMVVGAGVLLFAVGYLASGHIWVEQRLTETKNLQDRQRFVQAATGILKSKEWNPLVGIGYGGFVAIAYMYMPPRSYYDDEREPEADRGRALHNDYLGALVEQGLLGASIVALMVIALFVQAARALRRRRSGRYLCDGAFVVALLASAIALLAGSATHNCFRYSQLMLPFWVICALLFSQHSLLRQPSLVVEP